MGCSASLWLASPSGRLQGQSYNNVCDSKLITHNSKLKSRKRESLTEFCFRMTLPSVLSPVSHLFYKCIGLRPYPYLISPIRISPIGSEAYFLLFCLFLFLNRQITVLTNTCHLYQEAKQQLFFLHFRDAWQLL